MTVTFDESYYPVAPAAQDADPAVAMRDLFFRLSKAESSLQETELQRGNDLQEVLTEIIALSDQVLDAVEKADASDAAESAVVSAMVGFARSLREMLDRYQVEALVTIGLPLDPEAADVVSVETQTTVPAGTVLRERRIGYRWPNGILRKAQVVVSRGGK